MKPWCSDNRGGVPAVRRVSRGRARTGGERGMKPHQLFAIGALGGSIALAGWGAANLGGSNDSQTAVTPPTSAATTAAMTPLAPKRVAAVPVVAPAPAESAVEPAAASAADVST